MIAPGLCLRAALDAVAAALRAAGIEAPRREARLLLMATLDCSLSHLILHESAPLGAQAQRLVAMLERRIAREPLSRILGTREFCGLDFALGRDTLDPRPETEVLVRAALAGLAQIEAPRILDIGTGSGAILLALLHARPGASGIGIDIAPGALGVARANAARLGLTARARFIASDLTAALAAREGFDAILSNPPYIPSGDLAGLDPEVRLYDPARALDGGSDGLDFYRRITAAALIHLRPGGLLAFEIGKGQARDVQALMAHAGLVAPDALPDLAGITRVILARAPVGSEAT